ncbi:MAG: hypothetical protein HZA52_09105 [Planctomycetes bacterium]|nr:hypothetical protein [Planctomycetota bacterium]
MSAFASVSCARVRARLDRLLDRGLPELDEARDRGHLEACASCARELRVRRDWRRAFRTLELPSDDEFAWFTQGLPSRLARAEPPRPMRGSIVVWPRIGAAVALAAGALLTLALIDAWSGERPIEELFASAPRPRLSLEGLELPWLDGLRLGGGESE